MPNEVLNGIVLLHLWPLPPPTLSVNYLIVKYLQKYIMLKIRIESLLKTTKLLIRTKYELKYLKIEPKCNRSSPIVTSEYRQTDIVCCQCRVV